MVWGSWRGSVKAIRGKKALVTGAAWGIGRSIALALAREGADLFLLDIEEEKLAAVVEEARNFGVKVIGRRCDVAEADQITESVKALVDAWGKLDILVNNAGILYYGHTEKMSDEQWDRLLAVNLHAPIRFIRQLLPLLREQPDAHILNVCSIAGLVPKRKMAAYQMSKFALVGLSESLRAEYSPGGLGVTALCPGLIDTNLLDFARERDWVTARLNPPAFMFASPDWIGARAIKAIRRNEGLVVITAYARALWLLRRLSPRILDTWQHIKDRRKKR
jgi:NAD(P)-dependent dehydrogenase (short-subunit alcohol dehydrogenase family)